MAETLGNAVETAEINQAPPVTTPALTPSMADTAGAADGASAPKLSQGADQSADQNSPLPDQDNSQNNGSGDHPADLMDPSAPVLSLVPNSQLPVDEDLSHFDPATLHERYVISPGQPLPNFNSPTAKAYAVNDLREPGRNLYAIICDAGMPIRKRVMANVRGIPFDGMIPLVDFGQVYWSPLQVQCMSIIFERPLGGRLIDVFGNNPPKINEYDLTRVLISPLLPTIAKLASLGHSHGGIRLDNLYFMDAEHNDLVLGECVSAPASHDQPYYYEPYNRAMCIPSGRGTGLAQDDLYALGVLTLYLLSGTLPGGNMKAYDLNIAKLETSSYQALSTNTRVPALYVEPLRGLLHDDELERWSVNNLENWLDGKRGSPMQSMPVQKPKYTFNFADHSHITPQTLSYAFAKNNIEAMKIIKSGKLELWVRRSLLNEELADKLKALDAGVKASTTTADGTDEVYLSKVCMTLHPDGPIHYKNLSFLPSGFGAVTAIELLRTGKLEVSAQVLARDLVGFRGALQELHGSEALSLAKEFGVLKAISKSTELGSGMERCLYILNPKMPCQGAIIGAYYVDYIDDLLPALDQASSKIDSHTLPIDHHIAAFINSHFKHDVHTHLNLLNSPEEDVKVMGMLNLYAFIQWHIPSPGLTGLASWIGGLLEPAVRSYHSRNTRDAIEQEIPALIRQGSLPELFHLINNAERRSIDTASFEQAQIEFAQAEGSIQEIVGDGADQEKEAMSSAESNTAMFAIIVDMLANTAIVFTSVF